MMRGFSRVFRSGFRAIQSSLVPGHNPDLPSRTILRSEGGKSLPAALITLAVGSLLITPFLAFVSSRSLGTSSASTVMASQYSADAGIEYGIWSVLNDSAFRSQVEANLGIPQALSFPGTLNGYTPTISVTGLPYGSWAIREPFPASIGPGASLAYLGGDRIYALRGGGSRHFRYYSISANSWSNLANTPEVVQRGGALVYGGGNYLYALRGRNTDDFWRYNISTNTWSVMDDTPNRVVQGGELVWTGGNTIYAFRGGREDFWAYDITSDSWSNLTDAPARVAYGSDLVYTGGNYIYALRGRNSRDFWRYTISTDSWISLQNAPANVNNGGALAYYSGGYIYAFQGTTTAFWRYTISTDSWSILAPTPAAVGRGGDLIFTESTKGFALRGGNQTDFWEFEVTPPRFDIHADTGSTTTDVRIELDGLNTTIIFWDIE